MRPLELRLRNFRSYFGEDTVISFRDRALVGVVGPIGAGKSSLLDAVSFALFGRTPTVAASTKSLIHQRADGATVSLRFSVDDEVWEVTRALRRKGQSVHGLHRLSGDAADAEKLETLVLEGDVNEKVVDLLGLEFDGFSRSVMLAQGRFAEFLRSRPAERDKVLKGVFGHDKIDAMRAAAKGRAVAEATKVETLAVRLEAADALAGRIEVGRVALEVEESRLEALRKAEARFTDHEERREAAERVLAHSAERLEELTPLADRLPAPERVAEFVEIAESANSTRQRLGTALEEAQSHLASADETLAALQPAVLRKAIDEAVRLEANIEQLASQIESIEKLIEASTDRRDQVVAQLSKAESDLATARKAEASAGAVRESSSAAHSAATGELHAAQHDNMAATLRETIAQGEACPVCEQVVAALPKGRRPRAVLQAEKAVAAAAKQMAAAEKAHRLAATAATAASEALAGFQAEAKAAERELVDAQDRLQTADTECAATKLRLEAAVGSDSAAAMRKKLHSAEVAVANARKQVDGTRAEHDEAIRAVQAADKELGSLRITLTELATRLAADLGSIAEPGDVAAGVSTLRSAWSAATETLVTAKTAAERERAEVAAADRALRRELDIGGDFVAQLAEAAAAADLRSSQIMQDEKELQASDELRAQREAAATQQQTYEALAADLTDSKFVRYLLDQEKRELADLGSEHFERLSSGRYRFSSDGEFRIVDLTSADAVRKADSLSGGETFLASLALALALAEMVARTGGRLDSFFLDEGFGSLDPEHLDLAMDGIEHLAAGASNRLVIVVSHVAEMRHRLEDLIELDRDPVTGDTIVVHD